MRRTGGGVGKAGIVLAIFILLAGGWPLPASADSAATLPTQLPVPRDGGSMVWTGSEALLLGGYDGNHISDIVRYRPSDGSLTLLGHLPAARAIAPAVFDGESIYMFGGDPGARSDILRIDPATGQAVLLASKLPSGRAGAAAVWTGQRAYIFGGWTGSFPPLADIVEFDPVTGAVRTMSAKLPAARDYAGAAWIAGAAYLFGGRNGTTYLDDIVRYDPVTDQATRLETTLPEARMAASVAAIGDAVYILGGYPSNEIGKDSIFRFDPAEGSITTMHGRLPIARANAYAASTGSAVLLAGGKAKGTGPLLGDMVMFEPLLPAPPRSVTALAGPGVGEVTVRWIASDHAATDGVTAYRVYRGTAPGHGVLLAELGASAETYFDAGLDLGTTYYYEVRAVGDGGESLPSNSDCTAPYPMHFLPSIAAPCSALPGWRETVVKRQPVSVSMAGDLVLVDGRARLSDPRYYDLTIGAAGSEAVTLGVFTAGLPIPPVHAAIPTPVQAASAVVTVKARADPAEKTCVFQVDNACVLFLPVEPGDTEWLLTKGAKASLLVHVEASVDEEPLRPAVQIPFAGQVV